MEISKMMAKEQEYKPLSVDDSTSESDSLPLYEPPTSVQKLRARWAVISPFAWLFTTSLCFMCAAYLTNFHFKTKPMTTLECGEKLSTYSPAWEAVEYKVVEFHNGFFQEEEASIYRGKPTPELEKAWNDLWNIGEINVPYENLHLLNKSTDMPWQRTDPDEGGGVVGFLEVFHVIHCLDMVRQFIYRDEYDYSANPLFDAPDHVVWRHVDHCINTIRISLQCTSDVTPYLQFLAPEKPAGLDADFRTLHTCRNFDKIRDWNREHKTTLHIPEGHEHPFHKDMDLEQYQHSS